MISNASLSYTHTFGTGITATDASTGFLSCADFYEPPTMKVLMDTTECSGFKYLKPSDSEKYIGCFYCPLGTDIAAAEVTNNYELNNITLPSTVDLLFNNIYHGISDGTGTPIAFTATPGTG